MATIHIEVDEEFKKSVAMAALMKGETIKAFVCKALNIRISLINEALKAASTESDHVE